MGKTKENMWAIINQYKEKLSLVEAHEQRLEDEYAKVSVLQAKREARERESNRFITQRSNDVDG